MNIIFYYTPPERIGLKFENSTQRDAFWLRLGQTERNGINGQHAAELIGNRTIRFHAELIEEGFEWPLNGAEPVPVSEALPASKDHQPVFADASGLAPAAAPPNPQAQAWADQQKPESIITSNPFGFAAHVTSKPLPGMVPAPPAEMLAPLEPTPQPASKVVPVPEPPPPDDDPRPPGHHRSKAVNAWRLRQAERLAKAQKQA